MEEAKQLIIPSVLALTPDNLKDVNFGYAWPPSWRKKKHGIADMDFVSIKDELRKSGDVKRILKQMLASVVAAERRLKARHDDIANKRGFAKLPDEILGMILEYACHGHDPEELDLYTDGYSMVSHRFRNIMLGISSIWSDISSTSIKTTKNYLSIRSKAPVLSVVIEGASKPSDTYVVPMYKTVLSVSARIRTLRLIIKPNDLPNLNEILSICNAPLSFPFLEELDLYHPDYATGRTCQSMCKNWELPALTSLTVAEVLPRLDAGTLSRIKHCSFYLNMTSPSNGYWGTQEIVDYVLSLSTVEMLTADVRFHEYVRRMDVKMETVTAVSLGFHRYGDLPPWSLINFISFPSIWYLDLILSPDHPDDLQDLLDIFYRSLTKMVDPTSISRLGLTFGPDFVPEAARTPFALIGSWCQQFGNLDQLTLENSRDNWLNIFSFTGKIDTLKLRNLRLLSEEKGLPSLCDSVSSIPCRWDFLHRCGQEKLTARLDGSQLGNDMGPLSRLVLYERDGEMLL